MSGTPSFTMNSQSTRVRLFFDQTSDEQFIVLAELLSSRAPEEVSQLLIHTFRHEDEFLERLVAADLSTDDTSLLAGTVIRAADHTMRGRNWMEVTLTDEQIEAFGLEGKRPLLPSRAPQPPPPLAQEAAFDFADNSSQFYHFLMRSPTPFAMLSGPKHRFTFINQPYVDLIGRTSQQEILMKPVREVMPELEGQPFLQWLDEVYERGVQRIGREQVAQLRRQQSPGVEDRYFDFIYYPVRNSKGTIYGVMVQAADVTERVRAEAVSEHREETLFRQWAELDSIYRMAPVGMALIDAKSLRLLRINAKQAEMMGAPVADLLGKRALELDFVPPALGELFKRIELGETVRNAIVEKDAVAGDTSHRTWLVNISPFLGASGEAVAFTSISLEVPDEP
jgi:PAS domain-containing protein